MAHFGRSSCHNQKLANTVINVGSKMCERRAPKHFKGSWGWRLIHGLGGLLVDTLQLSDRLRLHSAELATSARRHIRTRAVAAWPQRCQGSRRRMTKIPKETAIKANANTTARKFHDTNIFTNTDAETKTNADTKAIINQSFTSSKQPTRRPRPVRRPRSECGHGPIRRLTAERALDLRSSAASSARTANVRTSPRRTRQRRVGALAYDLDRRTVGGTNIGARYNFSSKSAPWEAHSGRAQEAGHQGPNLDVWCRPEVRPQLALLSSELDEYRFRRHCCFQATARNAEVPGHPGRHKFGRFQAFKFRTAFLFEEEGESKPEKRRKNATR